MTTRQSLAERLARLYLDAWYDGNDDTMMIGDWSDKVITIIDELLVGVIDPLQWGIEEPSPVNPSSFNQDDETNQEMAAQYDISSRACYELQMEQLRRREAIIKGLRGGKQ